MVVLIRSHSCDRVSWFVGIDLWVLKKNRCYSARGWDDRRDGLHVRIWNQELDVEFQDANYVMDILDGNDFGSLDSSCGTLLDYSGRILWLFLQ